jgi:hypothetical protein
MCSPARSRSETQHATVEEAHQASWEKPPLAVVQSALQFALAVIVNEGRYSQIQGIISFLNIVVPGERTYYHAQRTVGQAIVELVMESGGKWWENLSPGSVIAMDDSWS